MCMFQPWVSRTWQGGLADNQHSISICWMMVLTINPPNATYAELERNIWERWGIYSLKEIKRPWAKGVLLRRICLYLRTPKTCHLVSGLYTYTYVLVGSETTRFPASLSKKRICYLVFEEMTPRMMWRDSATKNLTENIQNIGLVCGFPVKPPLPSWRCPWWPASKTAPTDSLLQVLMHFCSPSSTEKCWSVLLTGFYRNDSMWLLRLGHKRCCDSALLLLDHMLWGESQLPWHEDTQATLWRGPCG